MMCDGMCNSRQQIEHSSCSNQYLSSSAAAAAGKYAVAASCKQL